MSIISSDLVKFIVDSGETILNVITKIDGAIGTLNALPATVIALATAFKALKGSSSGFFSVQGSQLMFKGQSVDNIKSDYNMYRNGGANIGQSLFASISNNNQKFSEAQTFIEGYNNALLSGNQAMSDFQQTLKSAPAGVQSYINTLMVLRAHLLNVRLIASRPVSL